MIFVSHNRHKYEEIAEMFSERNLDLTWRNIEYEEIQAATTEEVSNRSCQVLAEQINEDFFLEDTGLYIEALNGFPGPYASYVVDKIGLDGILRLVDGKRRNAYFLTVISLNEGGNIRQFTGTVNGTISPEARGEHGFGYDPIFIPVSSPKTLSEMTVTEKNAVSHRAIAVRGLLDYLSGN